MEKVLGLEWRLGADFGFGVHVRLLEPSEPHDAHVKAANKIFRDCGFTLAAMAHKRTPEQLDALRAFNGLQAGAKVPFGWGYFPNAWCRDYWSREL